jgi:hypothetical protein
MIFINFYCRWQCAEQSIMKDVVRDSMEVSMSHKDLKQQSKTGTTHGTDRRIMENKGGEDKKGGGFKPPFDPKTPRVENKLFDDEDDRKLFEDKKSRH